MGARLKLDNSDEIKILAFGDSLTEGYATFSIPMKFHPYGCMYIQQSVSF
jgi:hypothetical protein